MTAMMSPWISLFLDEALEGVSRKELRGQAQEISGAYRSDGTSTVIRSGLDALAYATVRMPATYAAIRASLAATADIVPEFAPRSLLDIGAGPGTATWAAQDLWPSLKQARLVDRNTHLLDLARSLAARSALETTFVQSDVQAALRDVAEADVVIAGYALTELANDVLPAVLTELWRRTRGLLVVVEPGTPRGFARIRDCRDHLIAAGGHIAAPCTHVAACPLNSASRWCHFSQRLPRSRTHLFAKDGNLPTRTRNFHFSPSPRISQRKIPIAASWRHRMSPKARFHSASALPAKSRSASFRAGIKKPTRRPRITPGAMLSSSSTPRNTAGTAWVFARMLPSWRNECDESFPAADRDPRRPHDLQGQGAAAHGLQRLFLCDSGAQLLVDRRPVGLR
jgi:ubiquinone/menaquinone biosynthesis C-methylase UbiE